MSILDGILNVEQQADFLAGVVFIHQHRTAFQHIGILFADEVNHRFQQRMPRTNLVGNGQPLHVAVLLVKADTLVLGCHRHAEANQLVAGANPVRNADDFVAAGFALADDAAQDGECFDKERFDEVRLQLVCFHALHFFANSHYLVDVHRVLGQCAFFQ